MMRCERLQSMAMSPLCSTFANFPWSEVWILPRRTTMRCEWLQSMVMWPLCSTYANFPSSEAWILPRLTTMQYERRLQWDCCQ